MIFRPVLFHKRIPTSTYSFLVDKVGSCLNGWDARFHSMAARTTLVKSVLLAIPNYFMQVSMVPITIWKQIEKLARSFMGGSRSDKKKLALVNWNDVCQPCRNRDSVTVD